MANTITYPAASQSVNSPVTFTGTAAPDDVIELWDEPQALVSETVSATDSAAQASPPASTVQANAFQGNAFVVLGQVAAADPNAKSGDQSDTSAATDSEGRALDAKPTLPADTSTASDSETSGTGIASQVPTDTASGSDSTAYGVGIKPGQSDTSTASDSEGTALDIKPAQSDTSTASDSAGPGVAGIAAVPTDTASASESEGHGVARAPGLPTDTSTASDSQDDRVAQAAGQSDTSSATDTEGSAQVGIAAQSDTAFTSDAAEWVLGQDNEKIAAQSDTFTATDAYDLAHVLAAAQSSIASASDSEGWTIDTGVTNTITYPTQSSSVSSPVTFTGTATPPGTAVVELWDESVYKYADTASASDSETSALGLPLGLEVGESDTAAATDSENVFLAVIYASLSDTVSATEGYGGQGYESGPEMSLGVAIGRDQADTTTASEGSENALGYVNTVTADQSDTSTASDSETNALAAKMDASDTSSASDSTAPGIAVARGESETFASTDTTEQLVALAAAESDTSAATDSETRSVALVAAESDTTSASDSVGPGLVAGRTVSESASTTDSEGFGIGPVPTAGVGWPLDNSGAYLWRTSEVPSWTGSTITGWFYWADDANDSTVYWTVDGATNEISLLVKNGGDVIVRVNNGWGDSSTIATISTGHWYYFAIVISTSTVTGYIATATGALSSGQAASKPTTGTAYTAKLATNADSFGGYFAWVRAWNGGLSTIQINAEKYSASAVLAGSIFDSPLPNTSTLDGWAASGSINNGPVINTFSAAQSDSVSTTDALDVALAEAFSVVASQSDTATATDTVIPARVLAAALAEAGVSSDALGVQLATPFDVAAALQDSVGASDAIAVRAAIPTTTRAVLSAPYDVVVNQPFPVTMTLTNCETKQITLYYLTPRITQPGLTGQPTVYGAPRIALSSTFFRLKSGASCTAEWDAIAWEQGTYTLSADIYLRDGTPVPVDTVDVIARGVN